MGSTCAGWDEGVLVGMKVCAGWDEGVLHGIKGGLDGMKVCWMG